MIGFPSRRGFFASLIGACLAAIGLRPRTIGAPHSTTPPPAAAPVCYSAVLPPGVRVDPDTNTAADATICYSAIGLPPGLRLDGDTGGITGTIDFDHGRIRLKVDEKRP